MDEVGAVEAEILDNDVVFVGAGWEYMLDVVGCEYVETLLVAGWG